MYIEDTYIAPNNPWVYDFLYFYENVGSHYAYDPKDESCFYHRLKTLENTKRVLSRHDLVNVLRAYHQENELMHPLVEENLKRLERPDSVVVISGQQAGLLSGPLYTIYKAITVIQLAKREEERLGKPVIPVFWIAGEDHDLIEVDHIFLPRFPDIIKHQLRIPGITQNSKISIGEIRPHPTILENWLNELEQLLPESEYKEMLFEELKQLFLQEEKTLSEHFARLLHRLFGEYGLIQIDSSYPPLRKIEAPFFKWIIKNGAHLNQTVLDAIEQMQRKGYSSPLAPQPNQMHLFIQHNGIRTALFQDNKTITSREGDTWDEQELIHLVDQEPWRFSNNVVTRPLMQEYLFPTLAVVLGPGEIAYWGLLKEAFALAGMELPILYPRISATIIGRREEKLLRKYQLTLQDVIYNLEEKKSSWLNAQFQMDVNDRFNQIRSRMEELYGSLVGELTSMNSDLGMLATKNKKKVLDQVAYLENKVKHFQKEREKNHIRRFDELALGLYPQRKLQERVYNLIYYWSTYGENWIHQLTKTPLLSPQGTHRLIYL